MPILFPENPQELADNAISEFFTALPELRRSTQRMAMTIAILTAFGGRLYDLYELTATLVDDLLPDTASEDVLERWGSYVNIERLDPTFATGPMIVEGGGAAVISAGEQLTSAAGNTYTVLTSAPISQSIDIVSSIAKVGSTAVVTIPDTDLLASGITVTISGVDQSEYNGAKVVTVTGDQTFSFDIDDTLATPTGTAITASYITGAVNVVSDETGSDKNLESGDSLTFLSTIANVNTTAFTSTAEIANGTDLEDLDAYRERVIFRYQNPVTEFNEARIIVEAQKVAGVTRVFVEKTTPEIGSTTVYFTRDNDDDIIPSATEVQAVKDQLVSIIPAHMSETQIFVEAPTAVPVTIEISGLSPDTTTLRDVIKQELADLFASRTSLGQDLPRDLIAGAIYQAVDPTSLLGVDTFTLVQPAADITINTGEIPTLDPNNVSFT